MKRLLLVCLTAVTAALLTLPAQAAASADLVRTFVYEDTLYTYVELTGADRPITKADAKLGGQVFPASQTLETVRQADSPVTCLLLVDCSNSMPDFRDDVTAFASALAAGSGENTRFILTTFGTSFTVVDDDVPAGDLSRQMDAIAYTATQTRLHSSLDQALDYLEGIPREGNELRSVIVLSDAVQYDPEGGVPYDELMERISHSDVLVHAVGFGSDTAALEQMARLAETSDGISSVVGSALTAADAADRLTDYTGSLLVTGFPIGTYAASGGVETVSITFASGAELICRAEAEVELPASEGADAQEAPEEDVALPPADSGGSAAAAPAQSGEAGSAQQKSPDGNLFLAAGAGVAVVAVIAVFAVVLSRRKKAPAPAAAPPAGEESAGIYMRLEMLEGSLATASNELNLVQEILVGRDPACGLVFDSPAVSRRHARVFWADGVYLEDLGSENGTQVNGEAIQSPRQLRSGDAITVGDVKFRLKF